MLFILFCSFLSILIVVLFSLLGKKSESESLSNSVFECGFTSYYFSRFSFSMHYFIIGMIFLFLDLELCFLLPFFNLDFPDLKIMTLAWIFILVLIIGLLEEWKFNLLDWKF